MADYDKSYPKEGENHTKIDSPKGKSYQIGKDPPIFNVDPKRDSLISGAAKIIAEPYAEIAKKAYDKYQGKDD